VQQIVSYIEPPSTSLKEAEWPLRVQHGRAIRSDSAGYPVSVVSRCCTAGPRMLRESNAHACRLLATTCRSRTKFAAVTSGAAPKLLSTPAFEQITWTGSKRKATVLLLRRQRPTPEVEWLDR